MNKKLKELLWLDPTPENYERLIMEIELTKKNLKTLELLEREMVEKIENLNEKDDKKGTDLFDEVYKVTEAMHNV